jgi:hypothetical protein
MSSSRILPRLIIILACALLGASVGTAYQALRITGKPQQFRSLATIVTTSALVPATDLDPKKRESYDKIIRETLESPELSDHALKRVQALHPELRSGDMKIRASQIKGSGLFHILATGQDPKFTRLYLDALIDEFIILRHKISEQESRAMDVAVQERATPASENVESWKLPIALGAGGGGFLGGLIGLLLSWFIMRAPPQLPAAT